MSELTRSERELTSNTLSAEAKSRIADTAMQRGRQRVRTRRLASASVAAGLVIATTSLLLSPTSHTVGSHHFALALRSHRITVASGGFLSDLGQTGQQSVTLEFTADPSLGTQSGSGDSVALSWSTSVSQEVSDLANVFKVPASSPTPYLNGLQIGPDSGPAVRVDQTQGLMRWAYVSTDQTGAIQPTPQDPNPTQPQGGQISQSDASSTALAYLQQLGETSNLASPSVNTNGSTVTAGVDFEVDGIQSELGSQFVFGPGGILEFAGGTLVELGTAQSLTVESPTQVVSQMNSTQFCEPSLSDNSVGRHSSGSMPTFDVTIDTATLTSAAYQSTSGQDVLLPAWYLSGPMAEADGSHPQTFEATVEAATGVTTAATGCTTI